MKSNTLILVAVGVAVVGYLIYSSNAAAAAANVNGVGNNPINTSLQNAGNSIISAGLTAANNVGPTAVNNASNYVNNLGATGNQGNGNVLGNGTDATTFSF